MAMLSDMLADGTLLSFGGTGQWGAVHTWSTPAPENPGANRAADCLPLCGFAPGLLAHVHHRVGMGAGRGEG